MVIIFQSWSSFSDRHLQRGPGNIDSIPSPAQTWNVSGHKKLWHKNWGVIKQTLNSSISDIWARQRAGREIIIIRLNPLACPPCFWRRWSQEQIAEVVGISQGRVAQIINNTNFGEINNLLTQGRDMDYIARHYHMDLVLARQTYGGQARADPCPIGGSYAFLLYTVR